MRSSMMRHREMSQKRKGEKKKKGKRKKGEPCVASPSMAHVSLRSWGKERGLKVEVKGLEFSSVEALEAEKYDLVLHKMVEHIALEDSNEDLARELHLLEEYFERQPHVAFEPMRSVRVVMNRLEVAINH